MRILLQRVKEARVEVDGNCVGRIGPGLLLFVGVGRNDVAADREWLARKVAGLRIFEDSEGKMNLPVSSVGSSVLAVSQFTLYGDCRKGMRPGFSGAAGAEEGRAGFEEFVELLRAQDLQVECGQFQADMQVYLQNDGPVTLWLERGEA